MRTTNGHEWTRIAKGISNHEIMGKIRTTNAHECTRIAKELFNHEKHEKHEKHEIRGGRGRTTNAHECTRMAKEGFNHEKHERHESNGKNQNHECTRISSIHGIEALIIEMVMLRSWFCRGLRFATLWRSRHPRPTYCYCYWARNSGTNFAASSPPATPCPKESQYGGSAAVSERLSKMTNPIRSAVASCGVVPRAFHGMAIS